MKRRLIWLAGDICIAALIVLAIYVGNYLLPQKGQKAVSPNMTTVQNQIPVQQDQTTAQKDVSEAESLPKIEGLTGLGELEVSQKTQDEVEVYPTDNLQQTNVVLETQDWHQKFADKFTDRVVSTDTSYTNPDLSVQLSYYQYDSGKLDKTNGGKHEKYGTWISYVVADVYVGDIACLQTAFAQDTYGVGFTEKLTDMSARMQSVLAVNGDSYSNNRHRDNGTIIRNGVIYRNQQTDVEACVLNWDGTMDIYQPGTLDTQTLIDRGAYQSWIFGPSLLDENGKAKTNFLTWDYIRESHPRTAIGYYEPGHYCMVLVDGRQDASRGMFLEELSQLFEDLGCKKAYNLDGGHCSFMTLQDKIADHPYKPEHEVADGIFILNGIKNN